MAGDSKPVIPEWQRKATPSPPASDISDASAANTTDDASDNASPEPSPTEDRSALLEQARNFLSEPSISDASTSRKIEFLESKGLTNDEIQALLGVSRNEDASSPASEITNDNDKTTTTEYNAPAEIQTTVSTLSNNNAAATASSTTTSTSQPHVPPIITYPEFLVNASAQNNKPPLISFQGVLYSLYAAAGLGATIYGSSEYLVKPMLKTLTEARHDFAETALNNLTALNEKLEQNVSKIPANIIPKPTSEEEDDDEETESITSDPTELFHRDVATQTSPDLLSDSPPSSEETNADSESSAIKAIDTHTERLSTLTSHLKEFVTDHTSSRKVDDSARDKISDLQSYLDGLTYSSTNNYLGNNAMYNIYGSSGGDMGRNRSGSTNSKEQDAVTTFKAEIRGVKGALLSARNFPAGKAGVAR
jgi:ribosomal protein S15P/S13E